MSCDPERVTGYVDGALGAAEAAEIEAHLAECASCREQADSERALRARLRELEAPQARPELEPALRRSLRRSRPRSSLRILLPLVAALVLAVLWARSSPVFVARALAYDHVHCFGTNPLPVKVWSGEPEVVTAWFEKQGTPMPQLPGTTAGLDLIGGKYCLLLDATWAPHVFYATHGHRVSLFVLTHEPRDARSFVDRMRGETVRLLRVGGRTMAIVGENEEDVDAFRAALSVSYASADSALTSAPAH